MTYSYLVIDDEAIIRKGIINKIEEVKAVSLRLAGEAENGQEALPMIAAQHPDIVFTDMKMAKMSGVELLEYLGANYPDIAVIVISGYTTFQYMSKAIENKAVGYILKPFSAVEIEVQIKKAIEKIEQKNQIDQLYTIADDYGKTRQKNRLLAVLLEPGTEELYKQLAADGYHQQKTYLLISICADTEELGDLLRKVCDTASEQVQAIPVQSPASADQAFLLLSADDRQGTQAIRSVAEHLTKQLEAGTGKSAFYCCIGEPFTGLAALHQAYKLNRERIGEAVIGDRRRVFRMAEPPEKEKEILNDAGIHELYLKLRYQSADADQIMKSFFETIRSGKRQFNEVEKACNALLQEINQFAVQNDVETSDIMSVFFKRYILKQDTERMEKEITGYVKLILASVSMKNGDLHSTVEKMKKYLAENYHQKITLQNMADEFYMSVNTCSDFIKSNLHHSFNDYLKMLRMDEAKSLLLTTNLSAEKISEEIGYTNARYFFKIFKGEFGMTPQEYRSSGGKV